MEDIKLKHADWVYEQEAEGGAIHKKTYPLGPKHPESYLLYNDSGLLVFPRGHSGLYSSYPFWLEYLGAKEPIDYLGTDYFSSRELGISPDLIEELYDLQQKFMMKETTDTERIQRIQRIQRMQSIQKDLQAALHKIEEARQSK